MDIARVVPHALRTHPAVRGVRLVGSRAEGRETALSDWDFLVEAGDVDAVAEALPQLVLPLRPLAAQWDRLSEEASYYMLIVAGGVKVDVVLDRPPELQPPWEVRADTLGAVDAHFWDWILWLGGKQLAGRDELVRGQLGGLMWEHLLRPVGVPRPPGSIREAVDAYLEARGDRERELGVLVVRDVEDAVVGRLRAAGLA